MRVRQERSTPAPQTWRSGYSCNLIAASTSIVKGDCSASSVPGKCGRGRPFFPSASPRAIGRAESELRHYALGWGLRDYHGRKLVGHTGGVAGFVSRVMLVPEENLAWSCSRMPKKAAPSIPSSTMFSTTTSSCRRPTGLLPSKRSRINEEKEAAETMKKAEGARAANSKPSLPLEKYAGVYNDAWYGPITIRMENGGLVISFDHTPTMIGDLQPGSTTPSRPTGATVPSKTHSYLRAESRGTIDSAKMAAVSPLADFSFDYQDLLLKPA